MMKKFRNSLTKSPKKDEGTSSAPSSTDSVCHACGQHTPPINNAVMTEAPTNYTYQSSPPHKQHRSSWNSTSTSDSGYASLAEDSQTLCELDGGAYTVPYDPSQFPNSQSIQESVESPASSVYSEHVDPFEVRHATTGISDAVENEEAEHTDTRVPVAGNAGLPSSHRPTWLVGAVSDGNQYLGVRPRASTGPAASTSDALPPATHLMPRSRYARLNELPVVSPRASAFAADVFERLDREAGHGAAELAPDRTAEAAEKESRRWHKRATLSVGILPSQLKRLSLVRARGE